MTTGVTDPITIPQGTYGINLNFTVYNNDGTAYDLTALTITFKVWRSGNRDSLIVSGGCVIDVAASGTCHYTIVTGDFDKAGKYQWELELTKVGMIDNTIPAQLIVTESG